jgi:isocitrate dehydrogenase kinase/phosphatase
VSPVASTAAATVFSAFTDYNAEFTRITRRAARRFTEREWALAQRDAVERIELYDRRVESCVATLVGRMGRLIADEATWSVTKEEYAALIVESEDREFHQTFYNSVTRKVFATEGVNPAVEFDALECAPTLGPGHVPMTRYSDAVLESLAAQIVSAFPGSNVGTTEPAVVHRLAALFRAGVRGRVLLCVEVLQPVFFRSTRAYLVGRMVSEGRMAPLVIAYRSTAEGPRVDAIITAEADIRTLFGFSRSYFHVDLPRVGPVVGFLRALMPRKSLAEIYTVLGRAKQGKTERYRNLFHHLATTSDPFVHAEGQRGMVMAVFTLQSWDSVFKVIRDRFAEPKTASREEVMDRYRFVFQHDRVGRLVDAQEFRRLRFPRARFAPALLEELLTQCSLNCHLDGDDVIIGHCYVERRLRPLDVYLRTADPEKGRAAIRDYGSAIRELAMTNVFPGDLLLKNFGVSVHGRVVFYDYDEICLVTDCNFRDMPAAATDEDETRGEPWFYVGPNDVFPEQFIEFLGLRGELREAFLASHKDLLTAGFWRELRQLHQAERLLEILPYPAEAMAGLQG